MSVFGNEQRYGAIAQAIHWLTAILVLATWLVAGTWEGGHPEMKVLHETLGLAVFALVLVRVLWRHVDVRPKEVIDALGRGEVVSPTAYYMRVVPVFETASEKYGWLNRVVAVAHGHRLPNGAIYNVFEIT